MSEAVQLEESIDKAKEMMHLGEAVKRLKNNPDFKKVVLGVYFEKEPQRLTMLLGSPNLKDEYRPKIHESLLSIAEFHNFLNTILSESERAKDMIDEMEDTLEQLRFEEASVVDRVAEV